MGSLAFHGSRPVDQDFYKALYRAYMYISENTHFFSSVRAHYLEIVKNYKIRLMQVNVLMS